MASIHAPHSAKVRLYLQVDGRMIPLTHVCGEWVRTREDVALPPQSATIFIDVDDRRHAWKVYLPEGIIGPNCQIPLRPLEESEAA